MAKKSKRIRLTLEFYLRGDKAKIPSVNFIGDDHGVPLTSHAATIAENEAFKVLNDAAHAFCKQMKKSGDFN